MKETPRIDLANAQLEETRSRIMLAEGRLDEAEKMSASAAESLERLGQRQLLSDALLTRGVALARLGRREEARSSLERAAEVAEEAGDTERAGQAVLTIIEELCDHLSNGELASAYDRAAQLLASSSNPETLRRLIACARKILVEVRTRPKEVDWDNFSFREAVLRYESKIIEKALKDAGGVVSRAAQLLGMKHHNNLVSIINTRHRELLRERNPIIPRRRSIITRNKPRHAYTKTEQRNEVVKK